MKLTSEYNFARLYPELLKEWHPTKNGNLDPSKFTPGSNTKVWWVCEKGHEWKTSITTRSSGRGCRKCAYNNQGEKLRLAAVKRSGSLAENHPEVANQWHPKNNGDLKPTDISSRNNRKIWWICGQGHEWEATVSSRTGGIGCPYCSGRYPTKENNFATIYPELLKEWHPTKNGELDPSLLTPKNDRKVWWICQRGHEWDAIIKDRVNGSGCPFCKPQTSKLEIRIYTELKTIYCKVKWRIKIDDLECDVYLPEYKIGIEIDGYPWHDGNEKRDIEKEKKLSELGVSVIRIRNERLKHISDNEIVYSEGEDHLQIVTNLLKMIRRNIELTSKDNGNITDYIRWSSYQNQEEYRKIISNLPGPLPEQSVGHLFPDLFDEWNFEKNSPLEPRMFTSKSNTKVWWICNNGHEWESTIANRTQGSGCPQCYNEKRSKIYEKGWIKRIGSLGEKNPELASEWHPMKNKELTPNLVSRSSSRPVWWICEKGHEYETTVRIRSRGSGCPYCSGNKVGVDNNLAIKNPELAKEWHPTKNGELTPHDVLPGSHTRIWWKCNRGHDWEAMVNDRKRHGCPYCSGHKVGMDNNLAYEHPHIADEWHPIKNGDLKPSMVTSRNNRKIWWICEKGHEWETMISTRTGGSGCPKCYNEKRSEKYRLAAVKRSGSLAENDPEVAYEWHPNKNGDITPNSVTSGSKYKAWWICKKGHEWKSVVYDRTHGSGCPKCYFERIRKHK